MKFFTNTVYRFGTTTMLSVAFISSIYGQSADSLRNKFDRYRSQTALEKVYVHTDRSFYLTGETLWFKVYLVDGSLHKLQNLSKVVYVEVIDVSNKAVVKAKVEMNDGIGSGNLFLPATLSTARYTLRAYTNLMKNYPPEYFFHTTFDLVNPFVKPSNESKPILQKFDARFFPEGGNLISGVKSKVAFQVTDYSGKGINCRGTILNGTNDTIVKFMPLKFGIGSFYFTPKPQEAYRAVVTDGQGVKVTVNLPEIKETGFVMNLQEKNDQLEIKVTRQTNAMGHSPLYLFVHTRNIIGKAEVKFFQNPREIFFQIDKSNLADGVSHITLFDENLQPVCERLYFKRPRQLLIPEIHTNSTIYDTRSNIQLNLLVKHAPTNLSVSVFKTDSISQSRKNGIAEYIWLTADLKGQVESPEYYFIENEPAAAEAADNLMLTHGWRRFIWNDVFKPVALSYLPEYRDHVIRGIVKDPSGAPAQSIMTYLSSPSKIIRLNVSRSNAEGLIAFQTKKLYDFNRIIIQTNPNKDSIYTIELLDPFSQQFSKSIVPALELSPSMKKKLEDRSIDMQVTDIYRSEATNSREISASDTIPFYGNAYESYLLDDFTRFPVMEEVFREYIKNVAVRKTKDNFHLYVIDMVNKGVFDSDPLILIDGVPVFNTDQFMAFSPLKIRKIDVIDRKYFWGSLAFPGLVSCITYQGDLAGFELDGKKLSIDYEGLQRQTEYYTPRYPNQASKESRMPDNRTLLYWKASVNVSPSTPQQIEFYTSDKEGTFQVVVEGIATDGTVGSAIHNFEVKRK